jgi:hypothetical protein
MYRIESLPPSVWNGNITNASTIRKFGTNSSLGAKNHSRNKGKTVNRDKFERSCL